MIKTNRELAQAVNDAIDKSGYKKVWIADQLGITKQALTYLLKKQSFSIDDANKILNLIGYELTSAIKPVINKDY